MDQKEVNSIIMMPLPCRFRSRKRLYCLSLIMIPSLLLYQIGLFSRGGGGVLWSAVSSSSRGLLRSKDIPQEAMVMALVLQNMAAIEEESSSKLQTTTTTIKGNETKLITPTSPFIVDDWIEDTTMIYNKNITYRFSVKGLQNAKYNNNNNKNTGDGSSNGSIIVGVLSSTKTRDRRDAVRQTWAATVSNNNNHNSNSNVFFLLAGDWELIQDEFLQFQDIFWIHHTESYNELTWKTSAFIMAIQNHVDTNFTHILKTDDDSYVHLDRLEEYLMTTASTTASSANNNNSNNSSSSSSNLDYIGSCMDWQPRSPGGGGSISESLERIYPPYASGGGYVISRHFAKCFANVAQHFYYGVIPEDATTGLIARECHVTCIHDERIIPWPEPNSEDRYQDDDVFIQHYVNPPTMYLLHDKKCSSFNNSGTIDTTASTRTSPSCSPKNTDLIFGGTIPIMNHGRVVYRLLSPAYTQDHYYLNDRGNDAGGGGVVVAVMSMPGKEGRSRRSSIRNTWAKNRSNVYFIVATTDYNYVKDEFFKHGDIFWIVHNHEGGGKEEHKRDDNSDKRLKVSDQMTVFAAAIQKHLNKNSNNNMTEFRHILKIDDDSHVHLNAIEETIASEEYRDMDLIGNCSLVINASSSSVQETLDTTDGYLMSLRFADCLIAQNDAAVPWTNHNNINDSRFVGGDGKESDFSFTWCHGRQFECFEWE